MSDILSSLKITDDLGDSPSYPKATQSDIGDFEKRHGFKLPALYVEFLEQYNGGYPEKSQSIDSMKNSREIDCFFSLLPDHNDPYSLDWNIAKLPPANNAKLLPFAQDGFGNHFAIDFTDPSREDILYLKYSPTPDETNEIYVLADSFQEFIESLTIPEEESL